MAVHGRIDSGQLKRYSKQLLHKFEDTDKEALVPTWTRHLLSVGTRMTLCCCFQYVLRGRAGQAEQGALPAGDRHPAQGRESNTLRLRALRINQRKISVCGSGGSGGGGDSNPIEKLRSSPTIALAVWATNQAAPFRQSCPLPVTLGTLSPTRTYFRLYSMASPADGARETRRGAGEAHAHVGLPGHARTGQVSVQPISLRLDHQSDLTLFAPDRKREPK